VLLPGFYDYHEKQISIRATLGDAAKDVPVYTLKQLGTLFAGDYDRHKLRNKGKKLAGGFATLGNNSGENHTMKGDCPCGRAHKWSPERCDGVILTLTGRPPRNSSPKSYTQDWLKQIRSRAKDAKYADLAARVKANHASSGGDSSKGGEDYILLAAVAYGTTLRAANGIAGAFSAPTYPLRDSVMIDYGSNRHICNDLARMSDLTDPPADFVLYAGDVVTAPQKIGTMLVRFTAEYNGRTVTEFRAEKALYIPGFHTNCLSGKLLRKKGIWVDQWDGNLYYGEPSKRILMCKLQEIHEQSVIEYNAISSYPRIPRSFVGVFVLPALQPGARAARRRRKTRRRDEPRVLRIDPIYI